MFSYLRTKILPFSILLVACSLYALPTGTPSGNIKVVWDYPANELSTNLVFKIYSHTNITVPLTNWPVVATVIGTQTNVNFTITPGPRYFVITASNFWGESSFSNVASTPALPRSDSSISILKEP